MTTSSDSAARRAPAGPLLRALTGVERGIGYLGRATAWLTLALVLLVCLDVAMRYLLRTGSVAQQELQWHLLAVIAMISASYTFQQGDHVRVDILYQYYSPRLKVIFDILVNLLLVVPGMLFLAWISLGFVEQSWMLGEGSPDPSGLPARYVIKAFVPLGFALVAVQALARGLIDLSGCLTANEETPHGH
ncbi:TRAP transporter small permease subunit [Kushneria aurantia]|uniref:TRAP transporter small permease protein n=1 Tax=Kushneria aurantia TaxID=504092 RepID=A0ABV6G4P6_9GAMM|nr:TRAP transporter small permease subunit [Kushneria aurantia]